MKIRPATDADRDAIWNIFHEVVATGDTYALDSNISREDALAYWFGPGTHTYVAEQPAIGVSWSQRALGGRDSVAQWPSIA